MVHVECAILALFCDLSEAPISAKSSMLLSADEASARLPAPACARLLRTVGVRTFLRLRAVREVYYFVRRGRPAGHLGTFSMAVDQPR